MSEQLFYLEDKISDIVDDYLEVLNEEFKEEVQKKNLTKESIIKDIDASKHLKCSVQKGIPFFDIAETVDGKTETLAIECHCCNNVLYEVSKEV